ncbi:ADP-ribosyl cyclase/cyclic ADP-ribose hydrolase 1-like [Thalassophryne amazonica]|uniref:ADP-ribosyl cyclase/cyclic ADP-ribose hydrolase 1-like n=1 Tax=Thalassophryne amazonica TaxID=390379 RepID=UPI0014716552|nr:ADP-ribosyl cyclase/cyclic ADP-ribose hydrolase 1-like [Thalassophryne amazonica]
MSELELEQRSADKARRKRCLILAAVFLALVVVVIVAVALALRPKTHTFKSLFIDRCNKHTKKRNDCQKVYSAFAQAYIEQDPCRVSMDAYDPLVASAPFEPACNRMMFWSRTKDVVHDFTEKKDCFVTLEDTLLGSVLDGLTWCGKEGSRETFTTGCPGWDECVNNPVRSFWTRVSAAFADVACGDVTAMLNGSIRTPFSPSSIFGSIEVVRFNATRVKSLEVVLVSDRTEVANCTSSSFEDLQKVLDKEIKYNCNEVTHVELEECSADVEKPCGACW